MIKTISLPVPVKWGTKGIQAGLSHTTRVDDTGNSNSFKSGVDWDGRGELGHKARAGGYTET